MKKSIFGKTLLAILLVAGCLTTAEAKKDKHKMGSGSAKPAFDKGSKTLGIFLGAGVDYDYAYGTYYNYGYNYGFTPAVGLIYDQGIIGNAGPGTVGIGGIVAYKGATNKYYNERDYYTTFIFGVRGTYHLTILKDKNNKFDPYAGVTIGIRTSHYSNNYNNYTANDVSPVGGAFLGAKYNFAPAFGAFAEVGYDITFARIGINFNF